MRRFILATLFVLFVVPIGFADDAQEPTKTTQNKTSPESRVKISGILLTMVTSRPTVGANSRLNFGEREAGLVSAAIVTENGTIQLDWNESPKIREEILWWCVPRSGGIETAHAEVTGRIVFKRRSEHDGIYYGAPKVKFYSPIPFPSDPLVPVMIVESYQGYLATSGKPPNDSQLKRKRVFADERGVKDAPK